MELQTSAAAAVAASEFSVEAVLSEWLGLLDVKPVTEKTYHTAGRAFVDYLFNRRVAISETTLREYREWLRVNKSNATARLYFQVSKIFTSWCARRGYCRVNYADGIKGVHVDTTQHARDALSVEEAARVINSFTGDDVQSARNKAIMAVLICCGLRTVELVRLDVGDIERRHGVWTLRVWGKARDGKNATVVLPDEVKALIDRYIALRGKPRANEPLFTSLSYRNKNERLQTQTISRLAKSTFRSVGIDSPRIVCHSCRHTTATIALDLGADVDSVSKTLRHKSIATTELYRHDMLTFRNTTTKIVASAIFSTIAGGAAR